MEIHTHNPKQSISKYNHYQGQKQKVLEALKQHPKTMLMLSIETGILRANICRFFAEWKKQNKVNVVKIDFCRISKHRAAFYQIKDN